MYHKVTLKVTCEHSAALICRIAKKCLGEGELSPFATKKLKVVVHLEITLPQFSARV